MELPPVPPVETATCSTVVRRQQPPNLGYKMFGTSNGRMPARGELRHYLQGLEGYVERLINAPPGRARAESTAETVAERLSAMAQTIQDRAARAGSDASRYGDRAMEAGRDSLTIFAKEVSANPLAAVGAALGVGLIIGVALHRGTSAPKRATPARRVRRVRKGTRK